MEVKNKIPICTPVKKELMVITSKFGVTRMIPGYPHPKTHWGIDIGVTVDTDGFAAAGGRITRCSVDPTGYGKFMILHSYYEGTDWFFIYGHLNKFLASVNDEVNKGDLICKTGNTGPISTGPHLHFEMSHTRQLTDRENCCVNPVEYFV
ncbi:MAG: M23 family metallopeptidase [Candidatus Gracilibacteria bacterium]|jgi:murein DD-endopeptidase MepM/ murein hydrolase activator NlpD